MGSVTLIRPVLSIRSGRLVPCLHSRACPNPPTYLPTSFFQQRTFASWNDDQLRPLGSLAQTAGVVAGKAVGGDRGVKLLIDASPLLSACANPTRPPVSIIAQ